jgi:hypothetical protein
MPTTRQLAQGRTDLLMRVEELERRVEELEAARPKKAAPKPAEK